MPVRLKMSLGQIDLEKIISDSAKFNECLFKFRIKIEFQISKGFVSKTFIHKLFCYEQYMKEKFDKNIRPHIDNLIFYLGKSKCYQLINLRGYILEEFRIIRVCRYLSRSHVAFNFDSQEILPVSDDYQLYNHACQNLDTISDFEINMVDISIDDDKKSSRHHQKFSPLTEDQHIWNEVIKTTFGDPNTDSHLDWVRSVKENYIPDQSSHNLSLDLPETVFSSENESWFLS